MPIIDGVGKDLWGRWMLTGGQRLNGGKRVVECVGVSAIACDGDTAVATVNGGTDIAAKRARQLATSGYPLHC